MDDIKREEVVDVFHELEQFKDWAKSEGKKLKVLFIDESNINNQHLTLFEPLKPGGNRRVLYRGKLYNLSDNHRVVFARNPHHYGGGRNPQKLFADQCIPEFHLKDLPEAFIYKRLLKPLYEAAKESTTSTKEAFKIEAKARLSNYLRQKRDEPSLTVRSLQESLLRFLFSLPEKVKARDKNEHFIPTPSTKELRLALRQFIAIHQQVQVGIGLNCFYLEGSPGMGKSEMIAHILNRTDSDYIKLDASLPLDRKKQELLKAFENGQIVWMDEGNSCMDDGLEKWVNSLLSGIHPITGERSNNTNFMLLLTANTTGLEGRSAISPALQARALKKIMPKLSKHDLQRIVTKKLPPETLAIIDVAAFVDDLDEAFNSQKGLTLREVM